MNMRYANPKQFKYKHNGSVTIRFILCCIKNVEQFAVADCYNVLFSSFLPVYLINTVKEFKCCKSIQ